MPILGPPHTPKAPYTHLMPSTPNQSPSHPYQALHTIPWPSHNSLALYTHPRASILVPGSFHQLQNLLPIPDLPYHPRPSISVPGPPSTSILIQSHPSDALHTHQSLQYPSQALHTHLKPFTFILGTPYPTKALHTHTRPSIPFLGLHTIHWPFTPTLGFPS